MEQSECQLERAARFVDSEVSESCKNPGERESEVEEVEKGRMNKTEGFVWLELFVVSMQHEARW